MLAALGTSSTIPPVLRRTKVVGSFKVENSNLNVNTIDATLNVRAAITQVNDLVDIKNSTGTILTKVAINGVISSPTTGQQQLQGIWG